MNTTTLPLAASLVLLVVSTSSDAASASGRVILRGIPPPEIRIQMTTNCAQAQTRPPTTRHYVVGKDGGLANAFVVIRTGLEGKKFPPPTNVVTMECIACQLHPYVVAVQTGQPILFRNDSPFQENLHFTSRKNREWNFGLRANTTLAKKFDQPEDFIRIKGDVHPWFFGYLYVVDHPFFAVTGADGKFQLPDGLPDGAYTLEARHLKTGSLKKEIVIRNGRTDPVEFTFDAR